MPVKDEPELGEEVVQPKNLGTVDLTGDTDTDDDENATRQAPRSRA